MATIQYHETRLVWFWSATVSFFFATRGLIIPGPTVDSEHPQTSMPEAGFEPAD